MSPVSRKRLAVTAGLVAGLALASCSADDAPAAVTVDGAPADMPQMWVDEFIRLKVNNPDNEWLQQVLRDWEITPAEVQEGRTRFEDCMEDKGWLRPITSDEGTQTTTARQGQAQPTWGSAEFDALQAEFDADMRLCESAWMQPSWLRFSMDQNPTGADPMQAILDCMNRYAVPDLAGLTLEELTRAWEESSDLFSASPQAALCSIDPTGERGTTMEEVYWSYCGGESQRCAMDETTEEVVCEPLPPPDWCP